MFTMWKHEACSLWFWYRNLMIRIVTYMFEVDHSCKSANYS